MKGSLRDLFARVDLARDAGDNWCSPEKAATLASIVVALRPSLALEVGVWRGASILPVLFAMDHVDRGRAIAIDAWDVNASIAGETADNVKWWGNAVGAGGHERAYQDFLRRLDRHELAGRCTVTRARSDDVAPPDILDLLHIDGSHTQQAIRDVERFASRVRIGGMLVMDDLGWDGGGVRAGYELALRLGFCDLYPLGTGCVLERVRT